MIKTAVRNILESSTVTLAGVLADSTCPLYRLYDRNTGRSFRAASAATMEVRIDQGASPQAVDRLLIASGHNLAGMTLDIKYSDDGITYASAVSQWSGTSGVMDKSWNALTKRYWKFVITSPSSAPSITELFLTETYSWDRDPARPSGPMDEEFNVLVAESAGGGQRFTVMGPSRRRRSYRVPSCPSQMADKLLELNTAWGGSNPFWLYDHKGQWLFGALGSEMSAMQTAPSAYELKVDFREVLP